MKAPQRGLKKVDAGYIQPNGAPWERTASPMETFRQVMIAPFHKDNAPSVWTTTGVILMVFMACMINSWIFHANLDGMLKSTLIPGAGDFMIRAFISALVAASLFWMTCMLTFDTDLPTIIYPEIALATVGSKRLGLVTALAYCGVQMGAYASTGAIMRVLMTNPLNAGVINVATDPDGRVLLWFGGVVIVMAYIFTNNFWNIMEGEMMNYRRSGKITALAIFAVTVGFSAHGLKSYSSGLYVTASIATQTNVDWPFYVFIPLLAVPATVVALYLIVAFLFTEGAGIFARNVGYKKTDDPIDMSNAPVSARVSSKKNISVQY